MVYLATNIDGLILYLDACSIKIDIFLIIERKEETFYNIRGKRSLPSQINFQCAFEIANKRNNTPIASFLDKFKCQRAHSEGGIVIEIIMKNDSPATEAYGH